MSDGASSGSSTYLNDKNSTYQLNPEYWRNPGNGSVGPWNCAGGVAFGVVVEALD